MKFNVEIEIPDFEVKFTGLTERMVALASYNVIMNYWRALGIHSEGHIIADFDDPIS